jgi:hypothetical protein
LLTLVQIFSSRLQKESYFFFISLYHSLCCKNAFERLVSSSIGGILPASIQHWRYLIRGINLEFSGCGYC